MKKATDKRKEIPDAGIVGLRLIVQPTGDKSWTYRYVFGGKKKRLSLGKFPLVQLSQAREMARVAALKLSEGTDPAWKPPAPEPEKPANLFEDVARTYLRRCCRPNHGARHLKETARLFGFALDGDAYSRNGYAKSFCNKWGDRPVASLTSDIDLQDFLDDVIDSGTPIQAINMYQALGAFFRWCEGRAIVERNPMLKTEARQEERREARPFRRRTAGTVAGRRPARLSAGIRLQAPDAVRSEEEHRRPCAGGSD